ncbi:MAG TPA: hypothetical protein V6C97_24480 [Oculatellaceae cyanobacterium]
MTRACAADVCECVWLADKKAQLKEVQDLLDDLNTQFELVNQRKKGLEQQVKECTERLERAEKLTGLSTQHNTTQHNTTQHSTAQHSTAQHSTAQHSAHTQHSSCTSSLMRYVVL